MIFLKDLINYSLTFAGLITTTSRKLDREQQGEHILEVNNLFRLLKNSDCKFIALLQRIKFARLDYCMKNFKNWISEVISFCVHYVAMQITTYLIKTVCWGFFAEKSKGTYWMQFFFLYLKTRIYIQMVQRHDC